MDFTSRTTKLYLFAGFISLLISAWSGYLVDVINPDGICYLESAKLLLHGPAQAMHLCDQARWPFYSALIYFVQQLTHLPLIQSAYLLNSIFSCISVIAFIGIVGICSHNNLRTMAFAAAVILLFHHFNSLRQEIIRDHGFWAFYLVSIWFNLKFFQGVIARSRSDRGNQPWFLALGWGLATVIATLFRIEGAAFLLLIPFAAFVSFSLPLRQRFLAFFQLNLINIIIGCALALVLLLRPTTNLSRINEVYYQIHNGFQDVIFNFIIRAQALMQYVLTPEAARDSYLNLFLMMVSSYFVQVVQNLSIIFAALLIYSLNKKLIFSQNRLILLSFVVVNIFITLLFFTEHLFLASRYLIALSLTCLLWAPFALEKLTASSGRALNFAIWFGIIYLAAGGLYHFGPSKSYIYSAGNWLAKNTPDESKIYSNDLQVMFYTHRFNTQIFSKSSEFTKFQQVPIKQLPFEYAAIRINKHDYRSVLALTTDLKPVKTFENNRGDRVNIYKLS